MTTIIKWLNNPRVLGVQIMAWAILDLILWGISSDLNKSEWASWVQGIGTIAAIAGTFLAADRQVTQQRRHAAALVRKMFYPTAFALDELTFIYGQPSRASRGDNDQEPDVLSAEKWEEIADYAGFVLDQHEKFNSRIHRYEAGLNLLSANSLSTALALETELEDAIRDAVARLKIRPRNYDNGTVMFLAAPPAWSSRSTLATFNRHVQDYMAKLERESS